MDDIEDDDTWYPDSPYRVNHPNQGYEYTGHRKPNSRVSPFYELVGNEYGEDNNNEGEEEEERLGEEEDDEDDIVQANNIQPSDKDVDDDEEEEEDDANGGGDENCDDGEDDDDEKHKSSISIYEFPSHVPAPSAAAPSVPKPSLGRNSLTDWTEHETFVCTNSRIYSNCANGLVETRSSPRSTKSTGEEGSDRPCAKRGRKRRGSGEASSFTLLVDSLHKFSNVYEKIENDRRQQMVELETMRMDFQKEIETERRQILKRLQSEISKLEQTDDENDDSSENGM